MASRSGQSTEVNFSHMVSPLALMKLEEHDDAIAAITTLGPVDQDEIVLSATSSVASTTRVPSVRRDALRRIRKIGTGRFCEVNLNFGPSWLLSPNNSSSNRRQPLSLVAVKSIDSLRIQDNEELHLAAGELANEAKILSGLDHENIIRLKGVCSESFSESFSCGGYFLVFEVLRETLSDRLRNWRRQKDKKEMGRRLSFLPRIMSNTTRMSEVNLEPDERRQRMHHRIQETVLGIAKGLEYLHSNGIAIRDLKPANIGYEDTNGVKYGSTSFDDSNGGTSNNSVRLFDFGMAQKVEMCDPLEFCGSLRYMAPEVMTSAGYTLKVDVYSFGVVLFEICSLCYPYDKILKKTMRQNILHKFKLRRKEAGKFMEDFQDKVIAREIVPAIDLDKSVCCPDLRDLIEECCSFDPLDRPPFSEIRSRLDSIHHQNDAEAPMAQDPTPRITPLPRRLSVARNPNHDSAHRVNMNGG